MDFKFSPEQAAVKSQIVKFAKSELSGDAIARDRSGEFSRELWLKCGEMGLQGLAVPAEYGGVGLDPLTAALALEGLGYGCGDASLVFSVCVQMVACAIPIWKFAPEEMRRRLLPDLCNGRKIGCHAMTEPDFGSDAFAIKTRAVPDGNGFRISGRKQFVSNGPIADFAIVYAQTDKEKGPLGSLTAFLVEGDAPGFCRENAAHKMGLRSSPIGELVLDGVFVSKAAALGGIGKGAAVFNHTMDWERICLFASHVGMMERIIEKAVKYSKIRQQFGQSISKYQAVSHAVAGMKVRLEAARLLVYRAAWMLAEGRMPTLEASIAKLFVSESLVEAAMGSLMIHGGYGYMEEFEIERDLRDALASTIYSGTTAIQKNMIARWMGM